MLVPSVPCKGVQETLTIWMISTNTFTSLCYHLENFFKINKKNDAEEWSCVYIITKVATLMLGLDPEPLSLLTVG